MLLPKSNCVCMPCIKSVPPRACLAKVPFLTLFNQSYQIGVHLERYHPSSMNEKWYTLIFQFFYPFLRSNIFMVLGCRFPNFAVYMVTMRMVIQTFTYYISHHPRSQRSHLITMQVYPSTCSTYLLWCI